MTKINLLLSAFLINLTPTSLAFQEEDASTGDKKVIESPASDDGFPKAVYLDELPSGDAAEEPDGFSEEEEQATTESPALPNLNMRRSAPGPRRWNVFGNLGVSTTSFHARLGVILPMQKFFSIDPSITYWSRKDEDYSATGYGPEAAFMLRGHNPTMFTPFAGVGAGYENWQQSLNDEAFDDSGSATTFYLFGLDINMTKNFGLSLARKIKHYAASAPLKKNNQEEEGDNPEVSTEISFRAMF